MPRHDPLKTARNKKIEAMKDELRLPAVLKETGLGTEARVNATIGSKTDDVIDLKNEVIVSPDLFVALWMAGFRKQIESGGSGGFSDLFRLVKRSPALKKYLNTFLSRNRHAWHAGFAITQGITYSSFPSPVR
jgi:hypothetical protein